MIKIYCIKDWHSYQIGEILPIPEDRAEVLMRQAPGCFTKDEKKAQSSYSNKQMANYSNKGINPPKKPEKPSVSMVQGGYDVEETKKFKNLIRK